MSTLSKYKILIADNDKMVVDSLSLSFLAEGFLVETAHDGNEAFALAKQYKPDIVLLETMLTGMDGIEFCIEFCIELKAVS